MQKRGYIAKILSGSIVMVKVVRLERGNLFGRARWRVLQKECGGIAETVSSPTWGLARFVKSRGRYMLKSGVPIVGFCCLDIATAMPLSVRSPTLCEHND